MPESKQIRNLGIYGLIRQAEVDDSLNPDGTLTDVVNFQFDRKGASTVRLGMAALGSTVSAGNPALGFQNVQNATMLVAFTTTIYNRETATNTWNAGLTGLTSGQRTRFVDFANRTIMVNGSYDSIRVWNGSNSLGWVSTGNPINPQQFASDATVNTQTLRAKFCEVYKSRVYFAGDPTSPDRLFFSSVISSAGNISWAPSTDYVDINPSDGENITALKRFSLELLIFKPNYIYRFRITSVDPDPMIKIGTRSQESVIEGKRGLYFRHSSGFYRYAGGYPTEISRPISDISDNITYANEANVAAWKDNDHIYWSVGNIAITERRGITTTYANAVVRYTESSEVWTLYSYANGIRQGTTYNSGSALSQLVGTDNGVVATVNSGGTDLGEPISYSMITKWYDYGAIDEVKLIDKLKTIAERAEGAHFMVQIDTDDVWTDLGELLAFSTSFHAQQEFHRMRFKIAGVSSLAIPPLILGIVVSPASIRR